MNHYKELFINYLKQLKEEISSYKSETDVWQLKGGIKNTPGNLAMHICGNLQYNFGALISGSGYKRNRDYEFSQKDTPKQVILNEIETTSTVVSNAFSKLTADDMVKPFPSDIYGEGQTIGPVILRLAFHFTYHLGQINYHRRLMYE